MSAQSKSARAAMKDKAKRLASESSSKVDASDYRIPTDMHAEAKTGMRPVSKTAYKRGGAVAGEKAAARADRKPRAGKFYGGGMMNPGGQAMPPQAMGGGMPPQAMGGMPAAQAMANAAPQANLAGRFGQKNGGRSARAAGGKLANELVNRNAKDANEERAGIKHEGGLKRGGRAAKADGGEMIDPRKVAEMRIKAAADRAGVAPSRFGFTTTKPGVMANLAGMKKGGSVEGSAKDKREDKAMARARGMTMAEWEKTAADKKHDRPKRASGGYTEDNTEGYSKPQLDRMNRDREKYLRGLEPGSDEWHEASKDHANRMAREDFGAVIPMRRKRASGGPSKQDNDQFPHERGDDRPPMPVRTGESSAGGKAPRPVIDLSDKLGKYAKGGATHPANCKCKACSGGRVERASGGRAKNAKTNVNVIISTGQRPQGGDMLPPSMARPPMGIPVPPPMSAGAPPMGGGMPMPPPGAMPMPMPRATGGRAYRSYKDMDAGALSGKGRLEKTEIQARKR